ncbi:hypothetical protein EVAR_87825_1 [Eumeta japonica]|uniref:Uncharacterized protein n=1 Tax=Eumeta variegata TaxID=151549 RepID=A0A4C1Z2L0_EUMVA|nr:hypothetical protein EVAR_87825_1 [Eumeta japonica]
MGRPTKRAVHRSHPYCKPLRSSIDHHIRYDNYLIITTLRIGTVYFVKSWLFLNPGVVARATYVVHSHKIYFFSKTNRAKFLGFRVLKVVYFKDALSAAQASVARGRDNSRLAMYDAGYDRSPRD